jgi:biotin transport system substrate-specific component
MALATPAPRVLADVVTQTWVRNVALIVGGAAFVGISAQIAFYLPWNPAVPLTLQTFAVVLTGAALGSARGVLAMLLYAVAGVIGVPWFAEASSGYAAPSFGYIIGFILAAFVVGKLAEHGASRTFLRSVGLMIIGNLTIYAVGATWLKYNLDLPWFGAQSAWAYGVKDFLVGDLIKIIIAASLLPLAWQGLKKAGLTD